MHQVDCIRIFLSVAELSSFTAASTALGLPKASVSTAVRTLEEGLGTRLFHRTTRRVRLTQDGEALQARARDVLGDLDELMGAFQSSGAAVRGRLRVDMPAAVARDVIVPRLPWFLEQHPELELELSSTDRLVDVVREGFDCVLRVGTRGDSSLIARSIGECRIVNCVSPGYVERHGMPQSLGDLRDHWLVHYSTNFSGKPDEFEYVDPEGGDVRFVPMRGALTVNGSESYRSACLAGLGVIQVPAVGVEAELERGRLLEILPQYAAAPMPVTLLFPHRRHQPRRVRVFMEWLVAILKPHFEEESD